MSKDQKDAVDQEVMNIEEAQDGSAIVDLLESIPSPQQTAPENEDDADAAAERAEIEATGSVDPEQEAIREAKRQKRRARKDYHRKVEAEKDVQLTLLQRQNNELLERLSVLEKKSHGSEVARINKAIEDQESRIAFAKQKIAEATATGNGELLTSAQEMWFEARRSHEALTNLKQRSVAPQRQQTIQAPDPMLQRYASEWMRNNSWYDPNGTDPDSRVTLTIDQALADEGWNPKTPEYWEELDNRLQKYLPHRYTGDVDVEKPRTSRPRNVVTSSGRETASSSGGRNTFTLSPDQVRAMKDAGMWDDPDKRAKMIRRYATEARQNNGYRS
jgi:hypothetical protein